MMNKKTKITMKDMAEQLNVSISTVSRALANSSLVNEETRSKIVNLSEKLSFSPNINAKALVQQRTGIVGIILSNLGASVLDTLTRRLEDLLSQKDYDLHIAVSYREIERELIAVERMIYRRYDAIILDPCSFSPLSPSITRLLEEKIPFAILGYNEDLPANQVTGDFRYAGKKITDYLISKGHNKIAFVANPDGDPALQKGYFQSLKEKNIEIIQDFCYSTLNMSINEICNDVVNKKITAIFANCDAMAVSILENFKKTGLKVPDDIALVGCGNDNYSSVLSPPLTTYEVYTQHFADDLANILIDKINNPDAPLRTVLLKGNLVVRESA